MATLTDFHARRAASPAILDAIRDQACNIAIWERGTLPGIASLLHTMHSDVQLAGSPASLRRDLPDDMAANGVPASSTRTALIADIADLAERFCAVLRIDTVDLRLEKVTTDACRKFHADYVTARLITTYAGEGTQWLDQDEAARMASGHEPLRINAMRAGDVGLFKGKLATQEPAIHRSPPIAASGAARLLLVLNAPGAS